MRKANAPRYSSGVVKRLQVQQICDCRDRLEMTMVLMHEPLGNHRLQHRQKMIPIAVDVEDDDRSW